MPFAYNIRSDFQGHGFIGLQSANCCCSRNTQGRRSNGGCSYGTGLMLDGTISAFAVMRVFAFRRAAKDVAFRPTRRTQWFDAMGYRVHEYRRCHSHVLQLATGIRQTGPEMAAGG
jgi:hypothetical protein